MTFSITAELVLGTYRGHTADGGVERIPSVARLHSALLCAAGFGPRAQLRDTGLAPSDADDAALRWLEHNPPDAVSIPALQVNRGGAIAYRDDGTIKRTKSVAAIKKHGKNADCSVSVDGQFTWTWTEAPPAPIAAALEALCPDVPYLGTSEAPVRLRTTRAIAEATHRLDPTAGRFTGAGEDIAVPVAGRVDELMAAHAVTRGAAPPVRQDATNADEKSRSPVPPRSAARLARYAPVRPSGDVPWPEVVVVPLDHEIADNDKVRWAVAAHRALISTIDFGAPPLLTGTYPSEAARPANRIALQVLDPASPANPSATSALAVLVPREADPGELGLVMDALHTMPSIRGPRGVLTKLGQTQHRSGERFWPAPAPGTIRLWQTAPAAVPDTRGHGSDWTFTHAALLSLAFVWRKSTQLPAVGGRGDARYRALVAAVSDAGAVALSVSPLHTSAVRDYAHRVNEHAVVRPYCATIAVGVLGGDRTVQAIGQSRHLGGGLLVPYDLPEGTVLDTAAL